MSTFLILLVEVIGLVGVTNITTRSHLFQPIRGWEGWHPKIAYLLSCPSCSGFWVGMFYFPLSVASEKWYLFLLYACAVSAVSSVVVTILDWASFAKSHLIQKIEAFGDAEEGEEGESR